MSHSYIISLAGREHQHFAETICHQIELSSLERGTGIAKRTPEFIRQKMTEGKAVIALSESGEWAGFSYIESWNEDKFVANSGLIVAPQFRKNGLSKAIKREIFNLSRKKYPHAKVFSLTTGPAVMKINSDLGYRPVTYSQITDDENFWKGCQSCVNHQILMSKERKNCLCTALVYDPVLHEQKNVETSENNENKITAIQKMDTSIYENVKNAVQLFFKSNSKNLFRISFLLGRNKNEAIKSKFLELPVLNNYNK